MSMRCQGDTRQMTNGFSLVAIVIGDTSDHSARDINTAWRTMRACWLSPMATQNNEIGSSSSFMIVICLLYGSFFLNSMVNSLQALSLNRRCTCTKKALEEHADQNQCAHSRCFTKNLPSKCKLEMEWKPAYTRVKSWPLATAKQISTWTEHNSKALSIWEPHYPKAAPWEISVSGSQQWTGPAHCCSK